MRLRRMIRLKRSEIPRTGARIETWLLSASLTPLKIKFTQHHIFYPYEHLIYFVPPLSTIFILRLVSSSCFLVIWFVRELSSDSRFVTFSARGARRNFVLKTTKK